MVWHWLVLPISFRVTSLALGQSYTLQWRHNERDSVSIQITSLTIVYSTVYSDVDQRKNQSSASLVVVRGIHWWPVNSPHKGPVTRKMFPFDDVIMNNSNRCQSINPDEYRQVDHINMLRTIITKTWKWSWCQLCLHWWHQRLSSQQPLNPGYDNLWNLVTVTMLTLSSLVAPEVVVTTTSGATSDDKVSIMTTLSFQWYNHNKTKHNKTVRYFMEYTLSIYPCLSYVHFDTVTWSQW